jgi:hypothetical protein
VEEDPAEVEQEDLGVEVEQEVLGVEGDLQEARYLARMPEEEEGGMEEAWEGVRVGEVFVDLRPAHLCPGPP